MVKQGRVVGGNTLSQPPLKGPQVTEILPEGIGDRITSEVVKELYEIALTGRPIFVAMVEGKELATTVTLSVDSRVRIASLIKPHQKEILKLIGNYADTAFKETFGPVEDWLDKKYLSQTATDHLAELLQTDLTTHNDRLAANGYANFNTYFAREVITNTNRLRNLFAS